MQTREHGDSVRVLQVILEMEIAKGHIIVAHFVHQISGVFVAQQSRITLDKRMDFFLGQEIRSDALDFLRRTAVQRGESDAVANLGRNRLYVFFCQMRELI